MIATFFPLIAFSLLFCILGEEERPKSMFKVGPTDDDWLALPEVFSNLDFNADNKFAKEEDIEGQMRLRATRFWGRLYIDGWPQTIQFFRAHFGIEPPFGRKIFVFAEPRHGCEELNNADKLTSDHVLLVNRGTCTFGTKAKIASKTNASAVIIINNEPGLDHLPGPDAHDIQYSIVSIAQQEGQLLESVYDDAPLENGFGRRIEGYMVPINCEVGAKCFPATFEERRSVKSLTDGGYLNLYPSATDVTATPVTSNIEYLLAHFGSKVPHVSRRYELVNASPEDACGPLLNDVKGKVVLVARGVCPFVKKAEAAQEAGAAALVVGSTSSVIVRMGVEPRWKGLNTVIPVVMVSKAAFGLLQAQVAADPVAFLGFSEHVEVNGTSWEVLEKLTAGEGWPRSEAYVNKKYAELLADNIQWPDRVQVIKDAYAKVAKKGSTTEHSEL